MPGAAFTNRRNFDNPPWKRIALDFAPQNPGDVLWAFLGGYHPFTVTVEPDELLGWTGQLALLVANRHEAPTQGNYPTLGDPITGPSSFLYDAPFQWFGVVLQSQASGLVTVHLMGSQFSRNIQP